MQQCSGWPRSLLRRSSPVSRWTGESRVAQLWLILVRVRTSGSLHRSPAAPQSRTFNPLDPPFLHLCLVPQKSASSVNGVPHRCGLEKQKLTPVIISPPRGHAGSALPKGTLAARQGSGELLLLCRRASSTSALVGAQLLFLASFDGSLNGTKT